MDVNGTSLEPWHSGSLAALRFLGSKLKTNRMDTVSRSIGNRRSDLIVRAIPMKSSKRIGWKGLSEALEPDPPLHGNRSVSEKEGFS